MSRPLHLAAWNAELVGLPPRDPRRIGLLLLQIGATLMLAGMFLTPPWVNAGLGTALAGCLLARPPLHKLVPVIIGCLFAAWLLTTAAAAGIRGQEGAGRIPGPAYHWLAMPLIACAALSGAWRRIALRLLVCTAAAACVVALLQFALGSGSGFLRIDPAEPDFKAARGFGALTLTYGFVSALLLVVSLDAGSREGRWRWGGRVIGVVGMAISGSRAGLLAGLAGLVASLATRGRRWLFAGIAITFVLGGLVVGRMALTDADRLRNMFSGQDGRWPIWTASLAIVREHPLLGVGGREAFQRAYPETFARVLPDAVSEFPNGAPHAHNTALALAAEHGIPAVLLHLALLGSVLVVTWRRRRERLRAWSLSVGVVAAGVVGGGFEPYAIQSVPGFAFHGLLGLALGMAYGEPDAAQATVPEASTPPSPT